MQYKVVTKGSECEVWAVGFHGQQGKEKAQTRIDAGYFHKHMSANDKHKKLIVVPS